MWPLRPEGRDWNKRAMAHSRLLVTRNGFSNRSTRSASWLMQYQAHASFHPGRLFRQRRKLPTPKIFKNSSNVGLSHIATFKTRAYASERCFVRSVALSHLICMQPSPSIIPAAQASFVGHGFFMSMIIPYLNWFHEYILLVASEIRFIRGRLKFGGAKSNAPFPSMVVIFKPEGRLP